MKLEIKYHDNISSKDFLSKCYENTCLRWHLEDLVDELRYNYHECRDCCIYDEEFGHKISKCMSAIDVLYYLNKNSFLELKELENSVEFHANITLLDTELLIDGGDFTVTLDYNKNY